MIGRYYDSVRNIAGGAAEADGTETTEGGPGGMSGREVDNLQSVSTGK